MKLIDVINTLNHTNLQLIKNGYSKNISDFWSDFVEPILIDKNICIEWFDVLKEYTDLDDAIFVIRAGNRRVNGDGKTLRRGFYTQYSDSKMGYVYTDNDLAAIMYAIDLNNYHPNINELHDCFINKEFPLHFISSCKEERAKALFPIKTKSPKIGSLGYKVSHIIDIGMDYYDSVTNKTYSYQEIKDSFFPLGLYYDWDNNKIRYDNSGIINNDLKKRILKAIFMRFICPLNYVLTPKTGRKRCQSSTIKLPRNDIGESKDFQNYALQQFKNRYGKKYDEYIELLMIPKDYNYNYNDLNINLFYGLNIGLNSPKNITTNKNKKVSNISFTNDDILKKYYEYLINRGKQQSTASAYLKALINIINREKKTSKVVYKDIDKIVDKYTIGDNESIEYGKKSHNTFINSLRRFKEYKDSNILCNKYKGVIKDYYLFLINEGKSFGTINNYINCINKICDSNKLNIDDLVKNIILIDNILQEYLYGNNASINKKSHNKYSSALKSLISFCNINN